MKGTSLQMVFSPQACTLEHLERMLTPARRRVAEALLSQADAAIQARSSHNNLVIGPRGTGKTHLLAYVRRMVESQCPGNVKVKIVRLSEEERGLVDLFDFVRACLFGLNVASAEIDARLGRGAREDAFARAVGLLDEKLDDKPALIFVENLDSLFEGLGEVELGRLRAFLQERPRISLFASSIGLFQDSGKHDHAFYGYFLIHHLKPLERIGARDYLKLLAEFNSDGELADRLADESAQKRVNAIFDLTGGNHRLLAMLSIFLDVDKLDALVEPFVQMADRELTPYYQQRIDRLPAGQQRVIRILVQNRGAVSVRTMAQRWHLDEQALSRQLHDLLHCGLVRREAKGRESFYELQEPLLRLVFDLKSGADRPLSVIVELLQSWYTSEELRMLRSGASGMCALYLDEALAGKRHKLTFLETATTREAVPEGAHSANTREIDIHSVLGRLEAAHLIQMAISDVSETHALESLTNVIHTCDECLKLLGEREDLGCTLATAQARLIRGLALGKLGQHDEAIATFEQVSVRCDGKDEPLLLDVAEQALVNRGIALARAKRFTESLAVWSEVVDRFGAVLEAGYLEGVAHALLHKGITLELLGRSGEAVEAYDEVFARFGTREEPEFLRYVATSLAKKGSVLAGLGRKEEAVAVYHQVESRFARYRDLQIAEQVAVSLFNKGIILGQLGRWEDAIAAYEDLISRFVARDESLLLEQVAKALVYKGAALELLGRADDSIAAIDEVITRFGDRKEQALLEQVALAMMGKAAVLGQSARGSEALEVLDRLLKMCETYAELLSTNVLGQAYGFGAALLGQRGRISEAMASCDAALRLNAEDVDALVLKVGLLIDDGRSPEGLSVLRKLAARNDVDEAAFAWVLANLLEKGNTDTSVLAQAVEALAAHHGALVSGLQVWLQNQLPMDKSRAETLAEAEANLREAFTEIPGAQPLLDMLGAARRDALGDKKALMELPLELRRLILRAKGEEAGEG